MPRRRLLGLSAAALAGVPVGAILGRTGAAAADPEDDLAYRRGFEARVADDRNIRRHLERGREFLYRPGQLLVADEDLSRVLQRLQREGYVVVVVARFAGVSRLDLDPEVDIPSLVQHLRTPSLWPNQPVPQVQPHHVMVGFPEVMGSPDGPPEAAMALPLPAPLPDDGAGVTIGVCDTGIWRDAGLAHPIWLGGSYLPEADDEDVLYVHDDVLALQAGHGTFVMGVVRQAAFGASLDPEAALSPSGIGDEQMLAGALGRLSGEVDIVNLSLGYYTQDDVPPLPIVNQLAALPQDAVVVAAAGNAGSDRVAYPAGLDNVVAVAAATGDPGDLTPADYSNHGLWVDACAQGTWTSTYVEGVLQVSGMADRVFNGLASWSGTSFAAPYVAGRMAALMTQRKITAGEARRLLLAGPRWHDHGVLVP